MLSNAFPLDSRRTSSGRLGTLVALIGLLALLMAPLQGARAESGRQDPDDTWLPKDLDWSQATEIAIELGDHEFNPYELSLKKNQPYKVTLTNSGRHAHDLVDLDFYHAIVTTRIESGEGVVKTPHTHSLLIRKGGVVTLYMVPVVAGTYDIYCSVPGHRDAGMEAVFVIE